MRSVLRCPLRRWSPTSSRPCGAIRSAGPSAACASVAQPTVRLPPHTHACRTRTHARTRAHVCVPTHCCRVGRPSAESGKASLPFIVVRGTLWPLDSVLPLSPAGRAIPAAQTDGMNDTGSGRPACPTPIPNRPIGDPSRQSPLGTQKTAGQGCRLVRLPCWCGAPHRARAGNGDLRRHRMRQDHTVPAGSHGWRPFRAHTPKRSSSSSLASPSFLAFDPCHLASDPIFFASPSPSPVSRRTLPSSLRHADVRGSSS